MIGSNEFLMLLLNDINLGGSPASNSFSPQLVGCQFTLLRNRTISMPFIHS